MKAGAEQVTGIIPAFNAEAYVGETIESILKQTHPVCEVLVVDDGSTDGTASVVRSFGSKVLLLERSHVGAAAARNEGLALARGSYVAFLDADDIWVHDKLERQLARFRQRPEIDLCFTGYTNFWIPELKEEAERYIERRLSQPAAGWSISTLLSRLSVFERFGGFPETETEMYHNLLWALNAATNGAEVEVMPEVMMHRRLHHGNVSREWSIDEQFFAVVKAWRDYKRSLQRGSNKRLFGEDHAHPPVE